jgi:arsenate reductase
LVPSFARANNAPPACNPLAIETLTKEGISTNGLYSKSWDEFARPDAPQMDLVISICDNAAGEVRPIWLGQAMRSRPAAGCHL